MDKTQVTNLADQIEEALNLLRRRRFDSPSKPGIGGPERFMLMMVATLNEEGPVMPSEIAKRMGVTSAAITHHLNSLEEKGCLIRSSSPDDRRVSYVTLTEEGQATVKRFKSEMRQRVQGLVEHLGESDSQALVSLITKISAYMAAGDQS